MKKLFSLLTLALLTMSAWAATDVTITFGELYSENTLLADVSPITVDGVSLSFSKGEGSTAPQYYANGSAARIYKNNTMTVSAAKAISKIVFTYSGTGAWTSTSANAGTYADGTWTGNANSIVFTNDNEGTLQVRIISMVVTLEDSAAPTVENPVFTPASGETFTESLTVTITSATAGANIVYTVNNGDEISTPSPATVNLTETATIVAHASKDGVNSGNVTATYTKVDPSETTASIVFSDLYSENVLLADVSPITVGDLTLSFAKGEGSTAPQYYSNGTAARIYKNNTMTVTAPAGKVITKIEFTYSGTGTWTSTSPNVGAYGNGVWTGEANSIVFTNDHTDNTQVRIISMKVTYKDGSGAPTVAAPVFDPASGHQFTGSLTVTMTSATEGANIVYTVNNGDEITAPSPASVTIDADATITAYAQKDGVNSATVTATYTLKPAAQQVEYLEIAADLANEVEFEFTGNAVVTYQYNQYLYIKDETGYGLIYGNTNGGQNPKFAVGTMLAPGWAAKVSIYENLHEFVSTTGLDSCGITTVTPETITANQIPDKLNALVKIEHVKKVENGVATLIDGTTVTLYKRFDAALPTFDNADATITGIASVYGTTYQIYFISAEGAVNAPVITPASCNFEESQVVTITADEGAAIKYSTDEQATWNDYSEPLTITATTTVYAKAVKDGQESIVVSATYTKLEPVTYTLVTDVAELADGDKIILVGYCDKEGDDNYGKAYAMAAYRPNNNNFAGVEVDVVDNTVTTVLANVITLEANGDNWNLKAAEGYLYAASSDKNQMMVEEAPDTVGNANALIYMATDSMSISFQGTNTRNFLRFNYNNGTPLFSCYKVDSNVQTPAYIFKAQSDTPAYQRGDVNMDGNVDINDVTRLIDVVLGKIVEYDATAADCNTAVGDGNIDINDVTILINRVLKGVWD
jgi:hypothetical protein